MAEVSEAAWREAAEQLRAVEGELRKGIVGQGELVRGMLVGILANGHVLIEGVPGLGKTRVVNLLARICGVSFKRLQFTPDLLPADILGTRVFHQQAGTFETVRGPIFANFILADEINRAPAKVQSALLETMQERQVTIGRESIAVEPPFLVFATQNPIEKEGTYLLLDELGRHEAARRHFEHAASLGHRPEVPVHNLARSLARRGEYTEAHQLFQRAIELEPGLVDAHFNDGVTLYEWGRADRDPRGYKLGRTLELWRAARRRFVSITGGVVELDEPAVRAGENLSLLDGEIAALKEQIAQPPPECRDSPRSAAGGGGDGSESGGGDRSADRGPGEPPAAAGESPPLQRPLSGDELEEIGRELERIASQAREPGKFHRRTPAEQFSKADWSDPDPEIWW